MLENTVDFNFLWGMPSFQFALANNTRSHHPVTSSEFWRPSSSACGCLGLVLVCLLPLVEFSGTWKLYTVFDSIRNAHW